MVNSMSESTPRLLLPFAVPAKDRAKAFTKDMEMAAVFYLSESEREKGEQLILKKPVEKIVFIAEACYPLWLVPWEKRTLLFDGFGITEHTFLYDVVPDVRAFIDDIQASAETREAYSAALSNNLNYFQKFFSRDKKIVESLITNPELVKDLTSCVTEAKRIEKPLIGKACLSSNISESEISASLEDLSNLRKSLDEDIRSLRKSMKILATTTKEHVKIIRGEIREVGKKFDEKIAAVKPTVMEKLKQFQKSSDIEITELSKEYERKLRDLHKDRVKLEKDQYRLNAQIERCEAEIKSSRQRKDEGRELQWREKLKMTKKKLPNTKKSIIQVEKKIKDADTAKKLEISKIRSKYETKTEEAQKVLRELEASREASIRMKEQEMKSLEDTTSEIIDQMNEMVQLKKTALAEIDEMGMPKKYENNVLVYIPLYLTDYEAKQKRRYVVHPPSVIGSMGILTKFKGVFGMTRMKSFLQNRSKPLRIFLNQLVTLLNEDPVFEKETNDAGVRANIFGTKESRECIKKGLRELKEEGWISESESKAIIKLL